MYCLAHRGATGYPSFLWLKTFSHWVLFDVRPSCLHADNAKSSFCSAYPPLTVYGDYAQPTFKKGRH